jgi:mRNA-degrading endonuclease RelE of RelBE toxin-antitoxin system
LKSRTSPAFRKLLAGLPRHVREQALAAYRLFLLDPWHPSLHFKRVHPTEPMMSVRIGGHYRAVGIQREPGAIL